MFILNDGAIFASLGTGNSMQAKQIELESAKSRRDSLESQKADDKSNSGSSQTVTGGNQSTEVSAPKSSGPTVGQGRIDEQNALVAQLEGEISDMRGQASTQEGQEKANNQNQIKKNNAVLGT